MDLRRVVLHLRGSLLPNLLPYLLGLVVLGGEASEHLLLVVDVGIKALLQEHEAGRDVMAEASCCTWLDCCCCTRLDCCLYLNCGGSLGVDPPKENF
eukprot:scaffold2224_cov261-Pinguiococcus_pyrenoidosus.AAC.36